MLVNTFGKKISASLVVKNSEFYIEVAKFVQAYTVIISNPNDFLQEIGEPQINIDNDKLTWEMLSKIMQKCDFGFSQTPTNSDLLVYYNYALEMGSISKKVKRVATVDDIADAQKNYYNFVDDAKDRAENEYLKQHRISKIREKEVNAVKEKLIGFSFQKWIAFSFMIVAVVFFCLGVAGLFYSNALVEIIGSIIPVWEKQYIGSIILIVISVLMFYFCDKWHLRSKQEFLKLDHASQTIFARNDSNFVAEQVLKYKLDLLKKDLQIIQNELNDENKTFDVKSNIEKLIESNEYYKKYFKDFQNYYYSAEAKSQQNSIDNKEMLADNQQMETVAPEIIMEGQFDEEAYIEKFEKSKSKNEKKKDNKQKIDEKEEKSDVETEEKLEETDNIQKQQKDNLKNIENKSVEDLLEKEKKEEKKKETKQKIEESEKVEDYIDYIVALLELDDELAQRGK